MTGTTDEGKAHRAQPQRRVHRILLVDDHPMLRRGLADLISHEPDLAICGEAESAAAAMRVVGESNPDLAVVDLTLKDVNGLELIRQIAAHRPPVKVLVCSMHDEKIYAERALRAGAMGYLNKGEAADTVVEAIRQVLGGKIHLSRHMADLLLHRVRDGRQQLEGAPVDRLTDREIEVFGMLGKGLSTREIAARLKLSVKTIDAHRQKIKSKLDLDGSNELVQHAVKWVMEQT